MKNSEVDQKESVLSRLLYTAKKPVRNVNQRREITPDISKISGQSKLMTAGAFLSQSSAR